MQLPAPHTPGVPPPPQVWPDTVQVPQPRTFPQPSDQEPQFLPSARHVVGVQELSAHWPPVLQTLPEGHVPQFGMIPPQPSGAGPHWMP